MMSRTIRKRNIRVPAGQRSYISFSNWRDKPETRDARSRNKHKHKQWCFNTTHRTRRLVEREQINIVYKLDNYEDVWFNVSKAEKKRKSVWWEIF